jgi:hypothetical protein
MDAKIRIARATSDLEHIANMYVKGLGLSVLGSFKNHSGFDGVMLGSPNADYHFEFTYEHGKKAPFSNSPESLIVIYVPNVQEIEILRKQMVSAGFKAVKSHNPYWDSNGFTFEDFEGFRVVLCSRAWSNND